MCDILGKDCRSQRKLTAGNKKAVLDHDMFHIFAYSDISTIPPPKHL
jgi:hypothetical protein